MTGIRALVVLTMAAGAVLGQEFGVICSTDVPDATGPNNSHKLACRSELIVLTRDTVTLVFQSSQGVNMSVWQGGAWSRPVLLYPDGWYPAIDFGEDGDRHLVWCGPDSSGGRHVFYRNVEYRMVPLNVSGEPSYIVLNPDVCTDDSGLAHVAWVDYTSSSDSRILYRACNENGTIGEVFVVAEDTAASYFEVSVEQYQPDNALHVVWSQARGGLPHPFAIMRRRQVGGAWQPAETLASSAEPVGTPSLDFTRGTDAFSAGWYADVSRNREVHFEGGNGGGYPTVGSSYEPVLTTMGSIWSYLFWTELGAGGNFDICCHFFYGFPPPGRWYQVGTLREILGIDEDMRAPSCFGALVVWTEGSAPPYRVMWAYFGYPIPVEEVTRDERRATSAVTIAGEVLFLPASAARHASLALLNSTGRKVADLNPGANDVRHLASGVYFVRQSGQRDESVSGPCAKVVIGR